MGGVNVRNAPLFLFIAIIAREPRCMETIYYIHTIHHNPSHLKALGAAVRIRGQQRGRGGAGPRRLQPADAASQGILFRLVCPRQLAQLGIEDPHTAICEGHRQQGSLVAQPSAGPSHLKHPRPSPLPGQAQPLLLLIGAIQRVQIHMTRTDARALV